MGKEILFHGSENIVRVPEYGKGARSNDYGRGFYCTREPEMAKEWACRRNTDGYANRYSLDMTGLTIVNLNEAPYHILNWMALLAENRTYWQRGSISETAKTYIRKEFLPDVSGADIIIGYRADDSYFAFAQDFAAGTISLQKLSEAMHLGALGEQVVLKSRQAFEQIQFEGYEPAPAEVYFPRKDRREKDARRQYRTGRAAADPNDLYILDIIREEMHNNDPRLLEFGADRTNRRSS